MFRSSLGPVDPLDEALEEIDGKNLSNKEMKEHINQTIERSAVYLRPETAQAMFVQFLNVQQTTSAKVPFGIAQQGKSFRNEIIVKHVFFDLVNLSRWKWSFFVSLVRIKNGFDIGVKSA